MAIPGNGVTTLSGVDELLASLPEVGGRRKPGDGTEPGNQPGAAQRAAGTAPGAPPVDASAPTIGKTLEDADPQTQFKTVDMLCRSQDRLRRNRWAIDLYHSWLDNNIPFGRLDKVPNQNAWVAKLAPGVTTERSAAVPNKAADLCTKVTDALLADPPKPDPQPHTDDESVDAAADLMSEILRQTAGEAGINEIQHYRWALRNALTRSTSFLEYDVDQSGGGYGPYQILAHPDAQDAANPMIAPDPTGQPVPAVDPILRYVSPPTPEAPKGQFVDDASQADKVWLPKLVVRRHRREKVTLFPATARIEDADAAIIADFCTLAEAKRRWPETVGAMTAEQLQGLTQWRPPNADIIVPFTFRSGLAEGQSGPSVDEVGSLSPLLQRRMFFYRFVVKKSPEYPKGFWVDLSGYNGGTVLQQRDMEYQVTLPTQGTTTRCGDIRLVQVTPIQDVEGQDPMGWPFEARFDGSAQADAELIAGYLDALNRMNNPHVFIQSVVSFNEDEWFDRSKPTIIGPTDKPPTYEQFPTLPPIVSISEYLQTRQDTASGLTATAQGLDSENSQSGIAKQLTVRQAQVSLAGIQQETHGSMTRGWRLTGQIFQAEFETPQLIKLSGEDASSQEQWWTGEDLGGIDDIGIEPGTGSLMTAEAKANLVAFAQEHQWLPADRAADIAMSGMSRDLGLPPDVVMSAIERSVRVWLKGPPNPAWIQEYQQYAQQKQQYDQAQQQFQQQTQLFQTAIQTQALVTGGPPPVLLGPEQQNAQAMDAYQQAALTMQSSPALQQALAMGPPQQPQIPPPTPPWSPFEARANDAEPAIALKWMQRLSRGMMHPRYSAQPPEWRAIYDAKYQAASQAIQAVEHPPQPQPVAQPVAQPHPRQAKPPIAHLPQALGAG